MVIAKYIRLSLADQDLMKKENKTESESIVHQRNLIQKYINSHADLKGCEVREFFDDADIIGLNQKTFDLRGFTD